MKYAPLTVYAVVLIGCLSCQHVPGSRGDSDNAQAPSDPVADGRGSRTPEASTDEAPEATLPREPEPSDALPPEAVDHLAMTLTVDLEVFGVARERVALRGTAGIHRSGPTGADSRTSVGDVIALALRGSSESLGSIVYMKSPIRHSSVEFTRRRAGGYTGRLDLVGWLWLPERGLLLFGARPIRLTGAAERIPPLGQQSAMTAGEVPLFDVHEPAAKSVAVIRSASAEFHDTVRVESYLRTAGTTVPALARTRGAPK